MRLVTANALGYTYPEAETNALRVPAPATPLNTDGVPRAMLFHATSAEIKKWPQAHWIAVGQSLAARGFRVQLPWGLGEGARGVPARWPPRFRMPRCPPRMSITEVAQRLDAAALVVGMDTGFVHLADALGKPTVMIFTATSCGHFGVQKPGQSVSIGDQGKPPSVEAVLAAIDSVAPRLPGQAGQSGRSGPSHQAAGNVSA